MMSVFKIITYAVVEKEMKYDRSDTIWCIHFNQCSWEEMMSDSEEIIP